MKKWIKGTAIVILCISLTANVYLFNTRPKAKQEVVIAHPDQKIANIEAYLDEISPSYIADERMLAAKYQARSLGCGPSSYALAKILNKKFFDDMLPIGPLYNKTEQYQIVERFSFAQDHGKTGDHAWLEIYLGDTFLFIDPTATQFGGPDKIMYEVFTVGDPAIPEILKTKYHIIDMRLVLLINKAINRIPIGQEPYPGVMIGQGDLEYFLKELDVRNEVEKHTEPTEWHDWVTYRTEKYNK